MWLRYILTLRTHVDAHTHTNINEYTQWALIFIRIILYSVNFKRTQEYSSWNCFHLLGKPNVINQKTLTTHQNVKITHEERNREAKNRKIVFGHFS